MLQKNSSVYAVRPTLTSSTMRSWSSRLVAEQRRRLALLEAEPASIGPGETAMIAHALIVLTDDPEERQRHDEDVEQIAMTLAGAHEEAAGALIRDVSRPGAGAARGLGRLARLRPPFVAPGWRGRAGGGPCHQGQGPRGFRRGGS